MIIKLNKMSSPFFILENTTTVPYTSEIIDSISDMILELNLFISKDEKKVNTKNNF